MNSNIIGFTGTQTQPTNAQISKLEVVLFVIKAYVSEAHHGDCVGSDLVFHNLCRKYLIDPIHGHIPDNNSKRAYCDFDVEHTPKPYLERNKDIVDASDLLIATPSGEEVARSGTWSTIRYARKQNKNIIKIMPDGSVQKEDT